MSLLNQANQAMRLGQFAEAHRLYSRYIRLNPQMKRFVSRNLQYCASKDPSLTAHETTPARKTKLPIIGIVGWGISSGNGAMCHDLARLLPGVIKWLIPKHPGKSNHAPYIDAIPAHIEVLAQTGSDHQIAHSFLDGLECLIYVQNPCYSLTDLDLVGEAKKRGIFVLGIPMWEWWSPRTKWACETDALWAVTSFTKSLLLAQSFTLNAEGQMHSWRQNVWGGKWGVDTQTFEHTKRETRRFVFINGNGGYQTRKGLNTVLQAFAELPDLHLTIKSQSPIGIDVRLANVSVRVQDTASRQEVYADGDIFLFPSEWEGLCHGIYEAQATGAIVVTTDYPPMNECGTPYLIEVSEVKSIIIEDRSVARALPSVADLVSICRDIASSNSIAEQSSTSRQNIIKNFGLSDTMHELISKLSETLDREIA